MKKIRDGYAKLLSYHPVLVLTIFLAISAVMFVSMQMMETQKVDYQDMLPEDYAVIEAFDLIQDDFGGTTSGTVVIQIDNLYRNSNENLRVTDPEVVRYSLLLEEYLSRASDVESVSGFGTLVEGTYGKIPSSLPEIRKVSTGLGGAVYVSKDESMSLIKLSLDEDVDGEVLTKELTTLLEELKRPAGLKVSLSGEIFEDVIVEEQLGPDMNKTSMFSMIAIVVILLLLFRSFKGVAIPMMTIVFGILWTMGFLGLIGSGLSTMTSGAVSMIMGIGIDFGIQVMSRFSQEHEKNNKREAMRNTLNGILVPIFTTALACLIGFRAMSLGELSMIAELGTVMSYGVVFCMIAAISLVPCLLVIFTKDKKTSSTKVIEPKVIPIGKDSVLY